MDTASFLKKILPSTGIYALAVFRDGTKGKPAHSCTDNLDELARMALRYDRPGVQVFHACSSFKQEVKVAKVIDGRVVQVQRTRKADNAAFTRSQWLDVDVGPGKDYATRREAATALHEVCQKLKLPLPMIVKSGRGLHCYWVFTRDVPAAQAAIIGQTTLNALTSHGFKHDTSRTADLASVLRPVGTHWRKDGELAVELLRDADPISPKAFMVALAAYIGMPKAAAPASNIGDEWGTGLKASYPPSSAHQIIQLCGALKHVADLRGNVTEPLWRAMLGVVKHTIEGEALAHEWSSGHPDYDREATQEKLDNWTHGPTVCDRFAKLCEQCSSCPHAEKVKSPIHLGYSEDLPPTRVEPVEPPPEAVAEAIEETVDTELDAWSRKLPDQLPFWPRGYAWDGACLQRAVRGEDGELSWVPFANRLVYPYMRHENDEGERVIKLSALIDAKRNRWKEFDIPAKTVADAKACASALGTHEIYADGKNGKENMRAYMQAMIETLQDSGVETQMYNGFGWHDDGFVIGSTMVKANGIQPVLLGDRVPANAKVDFGVSGSAEDWAQLVSRIYNRRGAEPYQFIICAAFGAPLVKLAGSSMWHGIPIALTGDSGLGKTTTCKVACSIYGNPEHLTLSSNESGTTMNALIKRVAVARNLPIILDEMTGRTAKDMQDMLFALSNGQPKERLVTNGNIVGGDLKWDTLSFVTGNVNITALLAELDRVRADATQMRCFEIPLADNFNDVVFKGVNAKELIENELLAKCYGAAGRRYLQYVLKNRGAIITKLQKMRAQMAPTTRDETRERFYLDTLVTALLGGAIAKKLGLIDFDLEGVRIWALKHIITLRSYRTAAAYTPEDYFNSFLAQLHNRTVVTNHYADGRTNRGRGSEMVDSSRLRDPIARQAIRDRVFIVTLRGWNEWCHEQKISPKWLLDELDKRGYIKHYVGEDMEKDRRHRIFRNTNIPTSLARCIEFDYDRIDSGYVEPPAHLRPVAQEASA